MNNKTIISIVAVIVAVLAGYWVLNARVADGPAESEDRQVRGEVVSVDKSQVPADGPTIIMVRSDSGIERVEVPSMGINLCAAGGSIENVFALEPGMIIEVSGSVGGDRGAIVPCESEEHYLRVVSDDVGDDGNPGANDEGRSGEEEPVFCTMDAKLCPDGSYVGRTGPNCEFSPCPGE